MTSVGFNGRDINGLWQALAQGAERAMTASSWTESIQTLLASLGQAGGASRVWIFQLIELSQDTILQDYIFEWASDAAVSQLVRPNFRFFETALDDPVFRQIVEARQLGQGHTLIVDELPDGALKRNLQTQRILSMATVPIMLHGRCWGTLGIDDCQHGDDWGEHGLAVLRVTAELIAGYIYRSMLDSRSRQLELFQRVADCAVWELSLQTGEFWCSRAMRLLLGYPASYPHVPWRRLLKSLPDDDRRELLRKLREPRSRESAQWRMDVRVRSIKGTSKWYELVGEFEFSEEGSATHLVGLALDITERKVHEQETQEAAFHDPLTQVLNRRGFEQRAVESLAQQSKQALLVLDLDYFKRVNDAHGHPVGDQVLVLVTQRLRQQLRGQDILARMGGEEFVILLGLGAPKEVLAVAERLRLSIADWPFTIESETSTSLALSLTVSVGVAMLDTTLAPSLALSRGIARADKALYQSKHTGRNQVYVSQLMPEKESS
ncbi:hypothetical protein BFW38_06580 [Terasakiispira papahanaumokuakeensis]|uniref:diguanylate cyclase n=1 Tax=Terasakiispira papahanaumokuakeensis TaxID=197479 RepID=A0A1E2V8B8_9GAMM|nr:diguanylate cyclase [Terasakiispira papahanaumokuakeensis]ODC03258.1 hypothetical protein BFW38_06580 [Terasakiispira papahanaumokuakeensis]